MMKLAMSLICSVIIALLYSIFKGNITALLSVSDHCVNYNLLNLVLFLVNIISIPGISIFRWHCDMLFCKQMQFNHYLLEKITCKSI
jgi:hypothetical protein